MTPKELHDELKRARAGGYISQINAMCLNNLPLILSALSGLEGVKGALKAHEAFWQKVREHEGQVEADVANLDELDRSAFKVALYKRQKALKK